jgi:hypothetical protein
MAAREVNFDEFVRRLGPEDRRAVQDALNSGMGVARYGGMNFSYGRRGAVIETTFCPAAFGSAELGDFVSPVPTPATKRSPLMDAVGGPPQISRPRVAPSMTERPDVQFETRTSPHPRGDRGGFIDVQRFTPGREPQEDVPEVPLSEGQRWLRDHL